MQTKRDQVQAHMFVMGRLTSSMLRSDPDAPESPQGRTNRGTAIGVIIALVICAGAFVFGLIKPGVKDSWQTSGNLIVNRDTGSRYLYLDGRLRPVRNYASARLLVGSELKTSVVGGKSLHGTPAGPPVGIPGAPDALPSSGELSSGPWQVCSRPAADTGGASAGGTDTGPGERKQPRTVTMLAVSADASGTPLDRHRGLLVAGPDGTAHLVWQGKRLRLDRAVRAADALGYGSTAVMPVSAAFLTALPAGPDLTPPPVAGRGKPGPVLGGHATKVGQVFRVTVPGSAPRLHLLRQDGLVPLTDTAAALLLGDPATRRKAYQGGAAVVRQLGADALTGKGVAEKDRAVLGAGLPDSPPKTVDATGGQMPCVKIQPGAGGLRMGVTLMTESGLGPAAQPGAEGMVPACLPADRITVSAGRGALVRVLGAGGTEVGNTTYLVTDTGMKYRVPDATAMEALGYAGVTPQGLPSLLLSMLPTGPDLTTDAAADGKAVTTVSRCSAPGSGGGEVLHTSS